MKEDGQPGDDGATARARFSGLGRAWFDLNPSEQRALLVILALFLLGLAVGAWHAATEKGTAASSFRTDSGSEREQHAH